MAVVKRTELASVITTLLQDGDDKDRLAHEIAAYLVEAHRTKELDAIMRDVMTARAKDGIVEANVTTAFPFSAQVKANVQALLKQEYPEATKVVLHHSLKPEVLSGVRIQTPDKQLDETARGKLDQLNKSVQV